ncbi:protein SGT1 homolog B-like isoform X2 [Arachis stenosperma]|uniref:protein SGT1 homolog B-like isoform X2 n=2 Tax=Arachis stenosperma TaxID=217475 RepID=UPI0025ABC7AB|nr:protein SGT1 homolog B-like isoform X2 [Arachis stenosperma]
MKLKEYQTAKAALEMGASLAPGDSKFTDMLKQCHELIAESDVTPIIPEKHTTTRDVSAKELEQKNDVSQQMTVAVAKPKYRHEFYQKPDEVVVTIFAKGIPRDSVTVDFGEQILSVRIDVPGEDAYALQPRLFGKIVPSRCRYEVLSTKMEIRLAKAEPIHWAALEFLGGATVPQRAIVSSGNLNSVINVQRPTYPSSKPKRIDWDKLEAQVKKEEKDEKLDGDAALNKFFRQIYQDADEDTRRAMSKSFVESNGTVLSTNWKEVGSKKVQGSAPDGMELKKWEY